MFCLNIQHLFAVVRILYNNICLYQVFIVPLCISSLFHFECINILLSICLIVFIIQFNALPLSAWIKAHWESIINLDIIPSYGVLSRIYCADKLPGAVLKNVSPVPPLCLLCSLDLLYIFSSF